jgi:hypothetical protein
VIPNLEPSGEILEEILALSSKPLDDDGRAELLRRIEALLARFDIRFDD